MNKKIIIISFVSIFMISTLSIAQPMFHRPPKGECCGPMSKLELTTEQLTKFKEMKIEFEKEMLPIKSDQKAKRLELESLLMANEPDRSKINSVIEELGKLRTESQKKKIDHRLKMREQLTDDQKAIWDAMPKGDRMRGMQRGCRLKEGDFRMRGHGSRGRMFPHGEWW